MHASVTAFAYTFPLVSSYEFICFIYCVACERYSTGEHVVTLYFATIDQAFVGVSVHSLQCLNFKMPMLLVETFRSRQVPKPWRLPHKPWRLLPAHWQLLQGHLQLATDVRTIHLGKNKARPSCGRYLRSRLKRVSPRKSC